MQQILYSPHASSVIKAVLLARLTDDYELKNKDHEEDCLFDYPQIDADSISSKDIYQKYRQQFGEIIWLKDTNFSIFKQQINMVFRHSKPDKHIFIEGVVKESLDNSLQFVLAKATDLSRKFNNYYNSVASDIHANKGFCRLQPVDSAFLIGKINTEHNTGDLILRYFIQRFPQYKIALIDKRKNLAFVFDLYQLSITSPDNLEKASTIMSENDIYTQYWHTYFETQYIPEKKNTKLALKHFPKKRWNDMFEADFLRKHLE
ncbi:MAG: hypothetical protein JM58_17015 [Peptococcaceae bacterium BICA1-8]|nr:MAG: hypothetical protein JM58_17015 [Peptococcaceae bacterium BICA1-8]